jgi:glycosyltransferase involved in cell wall biosynthesis
MSLDVSVIVPTFRRPALLAEAIRSALGEEGVVQEVLVFDDAPEGSALEVVQSIRDPRVSYHKREVPSGGNPSIVRQEAWSLAKGRAIAFLDDDDRVVPGGYRALAEALEAQPGAAMAFGRVVPFGAAGAQLAHELAFFVDAAHRARHAQWTSSRMYLVSELLFGGPLYVISALMVRRTQLALLGGLDPAVDLTAFIDLGVRAAREYGCVFVDRDVIEWRYGADSLIHDPRNAERLRQAYRNMHRSYRKRRGALEFLALKAFARTIKQWM